MTDRKCIVTGQTGDVGSLLRFVSGPDGQVVPDLKKKLPGRGCWVTGEKRYVEKAVKEKLFSRGLKQQATASANLPDEVETLLSAAAVQAVVMARKAGQATSGAMQVDKAVRSGRALAVLHAREAAADGIRKIDQARAATVHLGGPETEAFSLLTTEQMSFAFGGGNVIHAAVLDGGAGAAALRRLEQLARYRGNDGLMDVAR